jgi:internalin A
MKVKKHLKLNINLAIPRAGLALQLLGTLSLALCVLSFPIKAISQEEATTPRTFADWCLNKANLSMEALHTVDVLLQEARTQDCRQADKLLSTRTELRLESKQIADLTPLSSLTNLTVLILNNNQIADLTPLSSLTNLTVLILNNNQIADLTSLSTLTNLAFLDLGNNQITNLKPLLTLTSLTTLKLRNYLTPTSFTTRLLQNNLTLTDKACSVIPEFNCGFIPLRSTQGNNGSGFSSYIGTSVRDIVFTIDSFELKYQGAFQQEAALLGGLGAASLMLGNNRQAIEFSEQFLILARQRGDRFSIGEAFANLGMGYKGIGEYPKAIEFHQLALAIMRELGNRQGQGRVLGNLGSTFEGLGDYEKSDHFLSTELDNCAGNQRFLGRRSRPRKSRSDIR